MKEILKRGATSNILRVFLPDSTSTTGAGKTGLTNTSTGLIISTIADNEATATTYTAAASNTETITTLGTYSAPSSGKARFKEVDATNFPGVYEIQIADARFNVANATQLLVSVLATGIAPTFAEIQLVTVDLYDTVRFGLTALPNVASGSAGAIITSGTGTAQLNVASGNVTVGTNNDKTGYSLTQSFPANFSSLAITAGGAVTAGTVSDKTGYSLTQAFPSNFSSMAITAGGIVTANTTQLAGQTVTASTGVTFPTSVGTSTLTAANVWDTDISGYTTAGQAGTYLKNASAPSAATVADAVWDEVLSGHLTSGSTGAALNAAGSAGDPWATTLPGAYGAGTAGKIIGDNINATISSRLASSAITLSSGAVTVGTNNDKTGYSLTQSFPANFALLAISGAGSVTAGTVSDKTGYSLSAGSITASTFGAAAITNSVLASGAISNSTFASTAIGSSTIASGAITSTSFGAGAITAAALATDAAEEIADTVWDETLATHTTAGTFGGRVLRAVNSNVEVQVTGSNHVAADIHELQPGVITSADFAAGAINANALATDAVTEIAQGVLTEATSTSTYAAGDVGNVLARLHNMIQTTGADFQFDSTALALAPTGGGGGGSTIAAGNVPYQLRADTQYPDGAVDVYVGTLLRLDMQVQDRDGNAIDLTGATVTVGVRNASTGATVGTDQSATLSLARLGMIYVDTVADWSATAGTYRITVSATVGTDVIIAGPLPLIVRSR